MEKKIEKIAVTLINAQTVGGVVEAMNRIAVFIDGYNDAERTYFNGLYEYIDNNDRTFQPLTKEAERRVKVLGARLLLKPYSENAVNVLVKLHHLLKWSEGEKAMVELTEVLYSKTEEIPFDEVV